MKTSAFLYLAALLTTRSPAQAQPAYMTDPGFNPAITQSAGAEVQLWAGVGPAIHSPEETTRPGVGSPELAKADLEENDPRFVIHFSGQVSESWEALVTVVYIFGEVAPAATVSVDFHTEPITATPEADYQPVSGTLVFAPGVRSQPVRVPIINDRQVEGMEQFRIVLTNPVGLPLEGEGAMTASITDNESGYRITWYEIGEDAGEVSLRIFREGDFDYASTVDYRISEAGGSGVSPGTATPGEDYVAVSGTLTFGPGDTEKSIILPVLADHRVERRESAWIVLSRPTEGVPLADSERQIFIQDNERMPLRVDPDFKPAVAGAVRNSYGWPNLPVRPLPDGRIVMATPFWRLNAEPGLGIVRLLPDGRLDPAFEPAGVSHLGAFAVQTNGQILVAGPPAFTINGRPVQFLARLNADGSLDPRFRALIPEGIGEAVTVVPLADGRILVGLGGPIIRLEADGTLDRTFEGIYFDSFYLPEMDHSGRVPFDPGSGQGLERLRADGTRDESFLANWPFDPIEQFALQPDDGLIVQFPSKVRPENVVLTRLTSEGLVDPAFTPIERRKANFVGHLAATPNGGFVFTEWEEPILWMLHFDTAGEPDAVLEESSFTISSDVWGGTFSLTPAPDGNLLIHGDILTVSGRSAPRLARLMPSAPTPRVELDDDSVVFWETDGAVSLHLIRVGESSAPVAIQWATSGGTAIPGTDYLPAEGSVTFKVDESEKTIELRLLDNSEPDRDRTVRLRITTAEGHPLPEVEVTIMNDDPGFVGGGFRALSNGLFLVELTGLRPGVRLERSRDLRSWEHDWDFLRTWDEALRNHSGRATLLDLESGSSLPYFFRLVSDD